MKTLADEIEALISRLDEEGSTSIGQLRADTLDLARIVRATLLNTENLYNQIPPHLQRLAKRIEALEKAQKK